MLRPAWEDWSDEVYGQGCVIGHQKPKILILSLDNGSIDMASDSSDAIVWTSVNEVKLKSYKVVEESECNSSLPSTQKGNLHRFHASGDLRRVKAFNNLGEMAAESGVLCRRFLHPSHPR